MTREEIRGIVEGISDEQLKKILDINSSDIGKAKAEVDNLKAQLEKATEETAKFEETLANLEVSQCEAEELKKKIEELQRTIDEKENEEKEISFQKDLADRFNAVSKDAKFVNEFTRNAVFEAFGEAVVDEKNSGISDEKIYKEIISGKDNLFIPDEGIPTVVSSTMGFGGEITDSDVREIMGLSNFR